MFMRKHSFPRLSACRELQGGLKKGPAAFRPEIKCSGRFKISAIIAYINSGIQKPDPRGRGGGGEKCRDCNFTSGPRGIIMGATAGPVGGPWRVC
ncbi:MAG TPA: hypothetical protein DEB16_00800 [Ruminococcaceae bacterium]|nr:hypothetical protein [Oscillospiraceae bacterium]HBQ46962.1 hypothetical protein [Oscillospiraceae bacterium]HBT90366.1 hypothetical protein [Oscillospiraceae bacterium]